MRYLLLSVLVVCVIGVMIPSVFAEVPPPPAINLSWTSLTITSSDGGTTIIAGETSAHFEALHCGNTLDQIYHRQR